MIRLIQGNPAEALQHLTVALGADSKNPELYFNIGLANHMLEKKEEALIAYKEFLRLASHSPAWRDLTEQAKQAIASLDRQPF
jgi:tetratricopeptide (TPR) repeat protein